MKKNIKKIAIVSLILAIVINQFTFLFSVYAKEQNNIETVKKNENSYWSTSNKPIFYGTTKITLKKGIIDKFDVLDTRFRIFAKDFEDGDLTNKITHSGNVDPNKVGNYQITYRVKDSHNNESIIVVPVEVTDQSDAKITVEKTLYTIPSTWNMDLAGFSRCNYGDRQILGIYMPKETTVKARIISSDADISLDFITNDSALEISQNLPKDGSWVTLQNKVVNKETNEISYYDAVPVFRSTVLSKDATDLSKTWKVELQYDEDIPSLKYYHENDDQDAYYKAFRESGDTYSVIENEVLTIVVPLKDIDRLVNHTYYDNGFKTLDEFLNYYQKVVDQMDEYIGLSLNPEKITDQNVRTKYLVRANVHGAGAAYYSGNHVGIHSDSISAFFQMNWGGLHELAHGYQGNLGKGEMGLGEVGNNIIGHYIQIDKDIYFHPGDWLGELSKIEDNKNKDRLAGKLFTELDVSDRLYMIVNLFDYFEGGTTYSKIFSWYREKLEAGKIPNKNANQDIYVQAIAEIYNVNIIPYMEAWNLTISDDVKEDIYSRGYQTLTILKDMVSEDTLSKITTDSENKLKYRLVDNETYNKYNIVGNATIKINIDDLEKIKGKELIIKDQDKIIRKEKITSNEVTIKDLNVGSYDIQMPILNDYLQNRMNILVKEGKDLTYEYSYQKLTDIDYGNYLSFILQGTYNTYGYKLTFSNHYKTAKIEFGQAGFSNISEASVRIYDKQKRLVSEEVKGYDELGNASSNGIYFNFHKDPYEVNLEPGYTIEVTHSNYQNKVKWMNVLNNEEVIEYVPTTLTTNYIVIEDGIIMEGMNEDTAHELAYQTLRSQIMSELDAYQERVTKEELENRTINFTEKSHMIYLYQLLNEEDQEKYNELITKVKQGGIPTVKTVGKLEYDQAQQIDLYSLIEVTDNEDGVIDLNSENTKIETNLDNNKAGVYKVSYEIQDSDLNKVSYELEIKINKSSSSSPSEDTPSTGGDEPSIGGDDPSIGGDEPSTGGDDQNTSEDETNPGDNNNGDEVVNPPENDSNDEENNDDEVENSNNSNSNNNSVEDTINEATPITNNNNNNVDGITIVNVPDTMSTSSMWQYGVGIWVFSLGVYVLYLAIKNIKE